jgi:hypothetical protein
LARIPVYPCPLDVDGIFDAPVWIDTLVKQSFGVQEAMDLEARTELLRLRLFFALAAMVMLGASCTKNCAARLEVTSDSETFEANRELIFSALLEGGFELWQSDRDGATFAFKGESGFGAYVQGAPIGGRIHTTFVAQPPEFSANAAEAYRFSVGRIRSLMGEGRVFAQSRSSCKVSVLLPRRNRGQVSNLQSDMSKSRTNQFTTRGEVLQFATHRFLEVDESLNKESSFS